MVYTVGAVDTVYTVDTAYTIYTTRSYAALGRRTWPGYSWGGTFWGLSTSGTRIGPDLTLLVTDAGSQLAFEMGEGGGAGINKNVTKARSQLTLERGRGAGQE